MTITIDPHSGFCFGVTNAIKQAEAGLKEGPLFCLGDIVHNGEEVERLSRLGLETIDYDDLRTMRNVRVLFRAHGEPPATYHIAEQNNIRLIDATCPVVKKLQERIRNIYVQHPDTQIVIYGQIGHAEVIGLQGQTNNTAIVIEREEDLGKLDFSRNTHLFSQTTKSVEGFHHIAKAIEARMVSSCTLDVHDTICRNVANRVENIREFAASNDIVFFVGGKKSSNAKVLYQHCLEANENTIFISSTPFPLPAEVPFLQKQRGDLRIGITGATSTPHWLMEQVRDYLTTHVN